MEEINASLKPLYQDYGKMMNLAVSVPRKEQDINDS